MEWEFKDGVENYHGDVIQLRCKHCGREVVRLQNV